MALHLVQVFTAELLKILIFKYSQSEENMYDCLLLDVIRLPSLYLQKLSNISITFHFLENFLQCYMYLQQIRFKTKLFIIHYYPPFLENPLKH